MTEAIRKQLAKLLRKTEFDGKVYLAGGCVRDELLGRQTNDIDLAVELPEGGIRLAEFLHKRKIAAKPVIYKQFGTALIQIGKQKIELVMTRRESYRSRSRKPEVEFGTLQQDVMRRDFTVNSLLKRISDGKLIDLSGKGLADLKKRLIRATSRPEIIFREDPLRLLRAVRFAVELDFEIEPETFTFIKKHASELQHISKERSTEEFIRILKNPAYLRGLNLLVKTNLLAAILPGLRIAALFKQPSITVPQKVKSELLKSALNRLSLNSKIALLLYSSQEPETHLKQLKLAQSEKKQIVQLINFCRKMRKSMSKNKSRSSAWFLKVTFELDNLVDAFINLYPLTGVFHSRSNDPDFDQEVCHRVRISEFKLAGCRFNLTGDDLIRTFCIKGAEIGSMLDCAREYWFRLPQASKQELLQYLKLKTCKKKK
ncbi:MAG: hypothetical protein R6V77_01340 [Candidatus Cloacimonadaceae bacterium]